MASIVDDDIRKGPSAWSIQGASATPNTLRRHPHNAAIVLQPLFANFLRVHRWTDPNDFRVPHMLRQNGPKSARSRPQPADEAPLPMHAIRPIRRRCFNCSARLGGRYCANCGQPADSRMPSALQFVHQTIESLTHADSRLWQTLKLLWLRPGQLTLEFIQGRRVSFLPPVKLYFAFSVIFFALVSLSHPRTALMQFIHAKHQRQLSLESCNKWHVFGDHAWTEHLTRICEESIRDHGVNLLQAAVDTMPDAMFVFVPLIALSHMVMYSRPRHIYAEHLLFFLHVHAFVFSLLTVWMALHALGAIWPSSMSIPVWLTYTMISVMPVYGVVALKRVFKRSWVGTIARTLALLVIYVALSGVMILGVLTCALLRT
jgi:Protein of unknown function (DUF3667)